MEKLLTIIIPVYNEEQSITKTLESVLNQTYENKEIIICDDCSTDNTVAIVQKYANHFPQITFMRNEKNMGVSFTRNMCLLKAKGDYIGFVDGDDCVRENMYEILIREMEENGSDIAVCKYHKDIPCALSEKKITSKRAFIQLLSNPNFNGAVCNKVYRSSVIKDMLFNIKYHIGEDTIFNAEAIRKSRLVSYVNINLYQYKKEYKEHMRTTYHERHLSGLDAHLALAKYTSIYNDTEVTRYICKNIYKYLLKICQEIARSNLTDEQKTERINTLKAKTLIVLKEKDTKYLEFKEKILIKILFFSTNFYLFCERA